MDSDRVQVNRAPVLTLWVAVVAERCGYDEDAALTIGKAVAGLSAQRKGRSLGIYGPPKPGAGGEEPKKAGLGEGFWVDVCGRPVPAKTTGQGVRAVVKDEPIEPQQVRAYLESKFGDDLDAVREAMADLAGSFEAGALQEAAFGLYEQFRPEIERGKRGWGQKGDLDLALIRSLKPG